MARIQARGPHFRGPYRLEGLLIRMEDMLCSTSIGVFITFSTLRLAYLQVLPQRRHNTGSCDGYLPLKEYGSFDKLSFDGFVVHTYNTLSHELQWCDYEH